MVGLGAALSDRAHTVTVATGESRREAVERAGLTFMELPLLGPRPEDDDIGYRLWGRAAEMAPALADRVRQRGGADLVVSDTITVAGAFAAELLGVPWIELSPHHLMRPSDDLPPIGLGRTPDPPWWRRRDDARLRRRQRESIEEGRRYAAEHRRDIGLPPEMRPPILHLLSTLPELEYARSDWPADTYIVGPLAADPPWPALPIPPGDDPLVAVTDSTATGSEHSLAEVAVEALRDAPVRLVVTTARTDLDAPPGVVIGRGPHGPLLDQAAVAVGPGGHGYVTKALSRGVPLVLVPFGGDQREAAARVSYRGLGRSLAPSRLGASRLRWEVLRVLADDSYAAAARRAAESARDLGPEVAADLVETAFRRQKSGRSTATS